MTDPLSLSVARTSISGLQKSPKLLLHLVVDRVLELKSCLFVSVFLSYYPFLNCFCRTGKNLFDEKLIIENY